LYSRVFRPVESRGGPFAASSSRRALSCSRRVLRRDRRDGGGGRRLRDRDRRCGRRARALDRQLWPPRAVGEAWALRNRRPWAVFSSPWRRPTKPRPSGRTSGKLATRRSATG
jgi:hypothetical protein